MQYITLTTKTMIISINNEKGSDKTQHSFIIEVINKLATEGTFLNTTKAHIKNSQSGSYRMGKS